MSDWRSFEGEPISEDAARVGQHLITCPEPPRRGPSVPSWLIVGAAALALTGIGLTVRGMTQPPPTETVTATGQPAAASRTSTPTTSTAASLADPLTPSLSDRQLASGTPVPSGGLPAGAAQAATTAVSAYARSDDSAGWWARVAPLLTPAAQQVYSGSDPRTVVWTKVTGPASALSGVTAPAGMVLVQVPTDAGVVVAHLRTNGTSWLVDRFDQPAPAR